MWQSSSDRLCGLGAAVRRAIRLGGPGPEHISGDVPTLSATFRAIMRYPFGRWALFALWLWFGWHIFVRGWHFLLRA